MFYGHFGRLVSYCAKLINAKETKLTSVMYKIHYVLHSYSKWLLQIKSFLKKSGFVHALHSCFSAIDNKKSLPNVQIIE